MEHVELKLLDLESESIFKLITLFNDSPLDILKIQSEITELLNGLREKTDDRAFVIVGSLLLESHIEELLIAFSPKFEEYFSNNDFTFSQKIKLCLSMDLIPSKIFKSAELINKIRNEFAHKLDLETFDDLKRPLNQRVSINISSFRDNYQGNHRESFEHLLFILITGLKIYSHQVELLSEMLRNTNISPVLKAYLVQKNGNPKLSI